MVQTQGWSFLDCMCRAPTFAYTSNGLHFERLCPWLCAYECLLRPQSFFNRVLDLSKSIFISWEFKEEDRDIRAEQECVYDGLWWQLKPMCDPDQNKANSTNPQSYEEINRETTVTDTQHHKHTWETFIIQSRLSETSKTLTAHTLALQSSISMKVSEKEY